MANHEDGLLYSLARLVYRLSYRRSGECLHSKRHLTHFNVRHSADSGGHDRRPLPRLRQTPREAAQARRKPVSGRREKGGVADPQDGVVERAPIPASRNNPGSLTLYGRLEYAHLMAPGLRGLARKALGVERTPTYYLPWLIRPGLDCVLLINNIEARFKREYNRGPFPSSVRQYDADGTLVRRYDVSLVSSTDIAEVRLQPTPAGFGFVTVDVTHLHSDLYTTLSNGRYYTATHGRHEFIETYPAWVRTLLGALGHLLALTRRTIPAFRREQFVFVGVESRSHLLLMNLSNVVNRVRVVASEDGRRLGSRLLTLRPMGSHTFDVSQLGAPGEEGPAVRHLHLQGNAWFNLYLVGAGPQDLAGPLSLMHVK